MSLDHRPLGRQEVSDLQTEVQKGEVNCQRTYIEARECHAVYMMV